MKNGAVVIGRFNPPTIGHYNLIDKVKSFILSTQKTHQISPTVFIVVVDGEKSRLDRSRNPLTASERISILAKNESCSGCKFLVCSSVIDGFNKMREHGFEPILIAGGDDRTPEYMKLLSDFNPEIDRIEFSLKRNIVNPEESKNILDHLQPTDIKMMSSTLARHAVKTDNLEKFKMITGLDDAAEPIFSKIKARISQ